MTDRGRNLKKRIQLLGCPPLLSKLCCTDGFLTWRPVLGYWPAALRPEIDPLVWSKWERHHWSEQLATQVALIEKQGRSFICLSTEYGAFTRPADTPHKDAPIYTQTHMRSHTFICHLPTLSGWLLCVSYYQHILILPSCNNNIAGTQTTQHRLVHEHDDIQNRLRLRFYIHSEPSVSSLTSWMCWRLVLILW